MKTRPLALAATCMALVFTAASCSDNTDPDTLPEETTPATGETTDASPSETETSEEPTENPSEWTTDYTDAEVRKYDRALQRFTRYEELSEPIWAEGKATDEAEQLFKDFFFGQAAQRKFDELKEREQIDVQISGTPRVHWSKPLLMGESNLQIEQCVDSTPLKATQTGEERPIDESFLKPYRRTIAMIKQEGQPWRIILVHDGSGEGAEIRPCKI